jgi:hypothetical protein
VVWWEQVQERLGKMTHDMAALHATCMQQQRDMQSAARHAEQQVHSNSSRYTAGAQQQQQVHSEE